MAQIETRNEMSLSTYLTTNPTEELRVLPYTTQSGRNALFFTFGKEKGSVSEKLTEVIDEIDEKDIAYAEIKTAEGNWMPCLFIANRAKVVRSFSAK